jgi:hypothetical protein
LVPRFSPTFRRRRIVGVKSCRVDWALPLTLRRGTSPPSSASRRSRDKAMCLTTPPGRVMPPGYAGMSDPPRELMSVVCGIPRHLTPGTPKLYFRSQRSNLPQAWFIYSRFGDRRRHPIAGPNVGFIVSSIGLATTTMTTIATSQLHTYLNRTSCSDRCCRCCASYDVTTQPLIRVACAI